MGTYVVCHNCKNNIHLLKQKNLLPLSFRITCTSCTHQDTYLATEAFEEKWEYSCQSCQKKFYRTLPPPANVSCPYCDAKLRIDYNDNLYIHRLGTTKPNQNNSTIAGGLLGSILGAALGGPAGAVAGGILGAAIGSSDSMKKAKEGW